MNLANKITITRIILIPFFITAVAYARMDLALIVFILATLSDGLDGFIARAMRQKTAFGTIIDPIADKLLLASAYISLAVIGHIPDEVKLPPYVPIIVISRDVIIVVGSIIVHVIKGEINIAPSVVGKITTFFQMATVIAVLVQFPYSYIVWTATVILTIVSGFDYIVRGSRLLSENHNHPRKAGA